jgi:zinc/manganese transport system permease protein
METLLVYPFLACLLLILIHTYFGLHILERGIIFVDLALAQFIGIGIALSFVLGEEKLPLLSLLFALLGALILSLTRPLARFINIEGFIGALYVFSLSAGILILDRSPHGIEEFKGILNGNIIWVTPRDLLSTLVIYGMVGALHLLLRKRFFDLSFRGRGSCFLELLFFCSFAVVLVKSVQIAGILQVFSFLVVPAMVGRLFYKEPLKILLVGWLVGVAASVAGILLSFKADIPASSAIVVMLALIFVFFLTVKLAAGRWLKGEKQAGSNS